MRVVRNRTTRYLFSGKELQDQTVNGKTLQLYDFGARNYDPVLGRWFNIDPLAAKYPAVSPYVYCLNSPVKFVDPNGEEVELFGIDRYLNKDNRLSAGTINNDMMRPVGGFEVSPYQNKAGEIIGWSAFRDGQIQYVMDANDIEEFTKNVSVYSVAADLYYMNGTPSEGMLKMLSGHFFGGLGEQWLEALMDPMYYMYVADVLQITAGMKPKGRPSMNPDAFHVTQNGVVLPKGDVIPANFLESKYVPAGYGTIIKGEYVEAIRIDAATPRGQKGPNISHFHLNGTKPHRTTNWPYKK